MHQQHFHIIYFESTSMLRYSLVLLFLGFLSGVKSDSAASQALFTEWSGWGGNYLNNGWASQNTHITSSNIKSAVPQCNVSYPIGVSATPVVFGNTVYYPTWNGSFVALDYASCRVLWQINVTEIVANYAPYTEFLFGPRPLSRTSPQIDGNLNPHPMAVVTMSPTFFDGKLFVGASSVEENLTLNPSYPCCSFVGWSGAALWGSQPAIDTSRRQVFVATGNVYSLPEVIIQCQHDTENITAVLQGLVPDSCLPANIWQQSVLAIDIDLGIVNWVNQLPPLDAYSAGCGFPGVRPPNITLCPEVPGLDADFAMAPTFVPGSSSTPHGKDTLVIGQKNGNLYAMSAQAGTIFWATVTSPGGLGGGLSWGVAVDDSRVYFVATNSGEENFKMQPSNEMTNRSAYGAASLLTGALLLVALKKSTGALLLDHGLGTNFHGGVAIQDQYVLFGTGYWGFGPPGDVPGAINVMRVEQ
ncbi:Quino protein alcohol dehydrogenase-like protein [Stipitochalara longipes BDJ]|nr:Quino protein alcohol dehydrogenase-like protein [Stipitochalara longipes BDJ]